MEEMKVRKYIISVGLLVLLSMVVLFIVPALKKETPQQRTSKESTAIKEETSSNVQKKIDEVSRAGGGVVKIPEGNYLLDEPIVLKTGVHLKGAGIGKTIIKMKEKDKSGKDNLDLIITEEGSDNIRISDFTINGEKDERKHLVNNPNAHIIVIPKVTNFSIDHIEILNAPSAGIILFNSNHGIVNKTIVKNSGSNAIIGLQDINHVKITNNLIDTTDNQNGIFISYQYGKSSSNIEIEGNTVKNAGDFGIEVGHTVQDGEEQHKNITVKNNKVINSRNAGIAFRTVSHGVIENNSVKGYGKTGGYGADGIFVEGLYNQSTDVKVLNNTVNQIYKTGNANGIYVTGLTNTLVEGNIVSNSRGKGLFIQASHIGRVTTDFPDGLRLVSDITVKNNQFASSLLEGIHVQGFGAKNIFISKNKISNNHSYGINVANIKEGLKLSINQNDIINNGLMGIEVFSQKEFTIEENNLVNNGKKAKKDEQSAIKLVSIGDGLLKDNHYEDNQEKPTQTYYLQIKNAVSKVTQTDKELKGGTKLLKNDTTLYHEISGS